LIGTAQSGDVARVVELQSIVRTSVLIVLLKSMRLAFCGLHSRLSVRGFVFGENGNPARLKSSLFCFDVLAESPKNLVIILYKTVK